MRINSHTQHVSPKHELIITSLHDATAKCTCGNWSYLAAGERTPEQVKEQFRLHHHRPQTPKQAAYLFFLKHAGYSYDPKTETKQAGRSRCARQLAKAERDARALGFTFQWDDLPMNHFAEYGEAYANGEPELCESCLCFNADNQLVASLGRIDGATREHRRVVEAELAMEALAV